MKQKVHEILSRLKKLSINWIIYENTFFSSHFSDYVEGKQKIMFTSVMKTASFQPNQQRFMKNKKMLIIFFNDVYQLELCEVFN